jgi:hypothetical protein
MADHRDLILYTITFAFFIIMRFTCGSEDNDKDSPVVKQD